MAILYAKAAAKAIERMDIPTRQRIKQGIESIPRGDIKPLRGSEGNFRLRIGGWRVLFSHEGDDIWVKKIAPRGEVYKGG